MHGRSFVRVQKGNVYYLQVNITSGMPTLSTFILLQMDSKNGPWLRAEVEVLPFSGLQWCFSLSEFVMRLLL